MDNQKIFFFMCEMRGKEKISMKGGKGPLTYSAGSECVWLLVDI